MRVSSKSRLTARSTVGAGGGVVSIIFMCCGSSLCYMQRCRLF
jgi:hypothetical protein